MKTSRLLIFSLMAMTAFASFAVTDREMEEARTIAARAYLRYANDGSGYLDEISVTSIAELTPKLKAKEKENLAVFNSVKVPGDYASWDKKKLEEFWGVTFFSSPLLDAKGKVGRARARKQLAAMKVGAPAAETPAKKAEEPAPEVAPDVAEAPAQDVPNAEEAVAAQQEILADQEAIAKDAAEASAPREEANHTWVYVLVLAILVAIVIWLVVYAANLMKRQPGADVREGNDSSDSDNTGRARDGKDVHRKNEEIAALQRRLQAEEEKSGALSVELERLKLDRNRLEEQVSRLRDENTRLQRRQDPIRETTREEDSVIAYDRKSDKASGRSEGEAQGARLRPTREIERSAREAEIDPERKRILKTIYLGRVNNRGIFVRADRRLNPDASVYRLDTNDGLVGTFRIVEDSTIEDRLLDNPTELLANGTTGESLTDTAGATGIDTVSPGTAIFENGYWRVLRKTNIRYI